MSKFGVMLISRPAGREAQLAARAYVLPDAAEELVLDFAHVKVLTPSWADEFLRGLLASGATTVAYEGTDNPSVRATLALLGRLSGEARVAQ